MLPGVSLSQYGATLAKWFGASDADLDGLFPTLPSFTDARPRLHGLIFNALAERGPPCPLGRRSRPERAGSKSARPAGGGGQGRPRFANPSTRTSSPTMGGR